ncbi:MAG: response regulator [Bacteroidales bacterium]|nr:response regulator [Bacteroidales bacterium]
MNKRLCIVAAAVLLLVSGAAQAAQPSPVLFRHLDERGGLPDNNVRSFLMLPDGRMLIRTSSYLSIFDGENCRNFQWDPERVPYTEYSGESGMSYEASVHLVLLKTQGQRWAFDVAREQFVYEGLPVAEEANSQPVSQDGLNSRNMQVRGADGALWVLTDKKVSRIGPDGTIREVVLLPEGSDDLFTALAVGTDGRVWLGSARSGLRIIEADGSVQQLPFMEATNGRRIDRHTDISCIYADNRGGIWIGTQNEGLLFSHPDILHFKTVNNGTLSGGAFRDQGMKCFAEAPDGQVLVGTVQGLALYDPATNRVSYPWPALKDALVISLYVDSQQAVWVGTFYDGIYRIDPATGRIRNYKWPEDGNVDLSYKSGHANRNCVRSLLEAPDGTYWISVYGGVGRFNPFSGEISMLSAGHPELGSQRIVRVLSYSEDGILEGMGDHGQFRYSVPADSVLTLSAVSPYQSPLAKVMSRVEYAPGEWWFTTASRVGRSRRGASQPEITFFSEEYGIACGAFLENAVLKHSSGKLLFGGASGFVVVDPEAAHLPDNGIAPVISAITVDGEPRFPENGNLTVRYNEHDISLNLSNLNYANPSLSVYQYILDGQDRKHTTVSSGYSHQVRWNSLRPGKYVFRAIASNNTLEWSPETALDIEVKPPFWATVWAFVFYALLAVVGLLGITWWAYQRQLRQLRESAQAERHRQEKELSEMKMRFFTNISHELRTPLSLILLPLESLMKEKEEGGAEYRKLDTMHRNAQSLLELVNHLLDFRKLEMGGEKLHVGLGSFSDFASSVVESFQLGAQEKGISLTFLDESGNPLVSFDKSMMQKVLNNLLSNALKYTPEEGAVHVHLTQEDRALRVSVSDNGRGIPAADLPDIFDRFYRSGNAGITSGTGIGLSLVKQYVEMHGGTVAVDSKEGEGSVFSFTLPLPGEADQRPEEETPSGNASSRRILVVDDNADFRNYLMEELSSLYVVTTASSGEDALKKLASAQIDLVISDVMMPGMSGVELTHAIKENVETSHIPVVLLTARTSDDVRTESYEQGADAYLTKPFLTEMLLARVRNLLDEREKRMKSFSSGADVSPMHVTITTVDQKLMARIMECLEKNMDNADYSVEQLAADVGMHRMNLYRKIQSLYGMTPSEFIRTMRLKRAAQIIADDPNLNVAEVAYMVGFNTPKYFTKYFKELFGVLPSQYKKP